MSKSIIPRLSALELIKMLKGEDSIPHTVSKPDFQLITEDRHGSPTTTHVEQGQVDNLMVGKEMVTVITKLDSKGRLIALKVRPSR